MEHPLNAFFLIQRFRTAWQLIDELVLNTDAFQGHLSLFSNSNTKSRCKVFDVFFCICKNTLFL